MSNFLKIWIPVVLLFAVGSHSFSALLDLDGDGLDDLWQEFYDAGALTPDGDEDDDGQSNQEECIAGTDPYSATSVQQLSVERDGDDIVLQLPTKRGKFYKLFGKTALVDPTWDPVGLEFFGSGEILNLRLPEEGGVEVRGGVTSEVWTDITGSKLSQLSSLRALPTYPGSPDGVELLPQIKRPSNIGDHYGGRLRGFIIPPESGDYTFYISSRNQGDLNLSPDESTNAVRIAWCYSNLALEEEWDRVAVQRSAPQALIAGQRYYFEVEHKHAGQEDHVAVAWEGPGIPGPGPVLIDGAYLAPWVANPVAADVNFVRVSVEDVDSDGDGLVDWAEHTMGTFNPFDEQSTLSGTNDMATATDMLSATQSVINVEIMDENAYEIPNGNARNVARFRLSRLNGVDAVDIHYTLTASTDPAKGWPSPGDYLEQNQSGEIISGVVHMPFGATEAQVVIEPIKDEIHEYPESLVLTLQESLGYAAGVQSSNEILIQEAHPNVDNEKLFVALYVPQDALDTVGFGIATLRVNGNNTQATLNNEFSALTSRQTVSHLSKSILAPDNVTLLEGPAVQPVIDLSSSLPILGQVIDYNWDLGASGAYTVQQVVDSLFAQNSESPLYIDVRTENYPDGEIWAFFAPLEGSTELDVPDDPPPVTPVVDAELRQEVQRFLTQATFGPTEAEVDAMIQDINQNHGGDRMSAFDAWIDNQFALDQTLLLDFNIAMDFWELELGNHFNYTATNWTGGGDAPESPSLPATWASYGGPDISAYDSLDSATWRTPNFDFPLSGSQILRYRDFEPRLSYPNYHNRRIGQWMLMMHAHDQLRQRLAFAWSQIMVVSTESAIVQSHQYGAARYHDMLAENADDAFRDMLEDVTYHPIMGKYLSHLKNQKAIVDQTTGEVLVSPDENYAREIMQLFSIGLIHRHLDGTIRLSGDGLPIATYDNDDITELSRVFTGLSFSKLSGNQENWDEPLDNNAFGTSNGNRWYGARYEYPMKMFGAEHDPDVKTIVGGVVIDNTNITDLAQRGEADVSDALDALADHENAAPFISRLLIQRLVTSNPSRGYLYRVAKVFDDTGGNMQAVTKAILLDYEARSLDISRQVGFGKLREPLLRYVAILRAMNAKSQIPLAPIADWGYPQGQLDNFPSDTTLYRYHVTDTRLGQTPMRAPTVFNWYLPDYRPGGDIASAGLFAPEFQIITEGQVVDAINYVYQVAINPDQDVHNFMGYASDADDVFLDKQRLIDFWNDAPGSEADKDFALIDKVDDLLMQGRFKTNYLAAPVPNPRTIIFENLNAFGTTSSEVNNKVEHVIYLMAATPEFMVQK